MTFVGCVQRRSLLTIALCLSLPLPSCSAFKISYSIGLPDTRSTPHSAGLKSVNMRLIYNSLKRKIVGEFVTATVFSNFASVFGDLERNRNSAAIPFIERWVS